MIAMDSMLGAIATSSCCLLCHGACDILSGVTLSLKRLLLASTHSAHYLSKRWRLVRLEIPNCRGRANIDAATAAAAVAGTTVAAAYLDAKYHISKDVRMIAKLKIGEREYAKAGTVAAHLLAPRPIWNPSIKARPHSC